MTALLTVTKPGHEMSAKDLFSQLMKAGDVLRSNPAHIAAAYARLATGPGRLSPADFMRLRLFDTASYEGVEAREFIGDDRMRDICLAANYRHDWIAVLSDKIASTSYLEAYGLPTVPVKAVYAPGLAFERHNVLSDKQSLRDFLSRSELYPLFGKPVEGQNSLGSIALTRYDASKGEVTTSDDTRASVDDLLEEIDAEYFAGYLFQEWLRPHPTLGALSNGRLASVRFITLRTEHGALIFRACLKVPAGNNVADNYWRAGNLLAQLDMESGKILRVTSGAGLQMQEHATHPDTNVPMVGFVHPQWEQMRTLALDGARLMRNVPLIGWDIACTDKGPMIVEMNESPDPFLTQFADRRGLLDETLERFIEFQNRNSAAFNAKMRLRYNGH